MIPRLVLSFESRPVLNLLSSFKTNQPRPSSINKAPPLQLRKTFPHHQHSVLVSSPPSALYDDQLSRYCLSNQLMNFKSRLFTFPIYWWELCPISLTRALVPKVPPLHLRKTSPSPPVLSPLSSPPLPRAAISILKLPFSNHFTSLRCPAFSPVKIMILYPLASQLSSVPQKGLFSHWSFQ